MWAEEVITSIGILTELIPDINRGEQLRTSESLSTFCAGTPIDLRLTFLG